MQNYTSTTAASAFGLGPSVKFRWVWVLVDVCSPSYFIHAVKNYVKCTSGNVSNKAKSLTKIVVPFWVSKTEKSEQPLITAAVKFYIHAANETF